MKKSEMISLMEDVWLNYTKNLKPDYQGVRNGMELVLERMELEGILPPNRKVKFDGTDGKVHTTLERSWKPER